MRIAILVPRTHLHELIRWPLRLPEETSSPARNRAADGHGASEAVSIEAAASGYLGIFSRRHGVQIGITSAPADDGTAAFDSARLRTSRTDFREFPRGSWLQMTVF